MTTVLRTSVWAALAGTTAAALAAWLPLDGDSSRRETAPPPASAQTHTTTRVAPLAFEANQGQAEPEVAFLLRGRSATFLLRTPEVVFVTGRSGSVSMRVVDGNPSPVVRGDDELPGRVNWLVGNDPSRWRRDIPTFERVVYEQVLPGVDLVFHGVGGFLEYDFVLAPGADPEAVRLAFDGADAVEVDGAGALVVTAGGASIRQQPPRIWQTVDGRREPVAGGFRLVPGTSHVAFQIGDHDPRASLVIDPVVVFATFLGDVGTDRAEDVAVDARGFAYVVGTTFSPTFPRHNLRFVSPPNLSGNADVFVTKWNRTGTAVLWTSFLGGYRDDNGTGVALGTDGSVHVTGMTRSSDLPTKDAIQAALQGTPGALGTLDAFVIRLDPEGTAVTFGTYLGGTAIEETPSIALDADDDVYVAGTTRSYDFPTVAALQGAFGGSYPSEPQDVFVTAMRPGEGAYRYSTYVGGAGSDYAKAVAVDPEGSACVTGYTYSGNFPTSSPRQAASGGSGDAFVFRLTASGNFVYSTFLGGSSTDGGASVGLVAGGKAVVLGNAGSPDFPIGDPIHPGTGGNFLMQFDATGALEWSTYVDGPGAAVDVALDSAGRIHVASGSFTTRLAAGGVSVDWSLPMTGTPKGIATDPFGSLFLVGIGTSRFTTVNAFQAQRGPLDPDRPDTEPQDAFVMKVVDAVVTPATPTALEAAVRSYRQVDLTWQFARDDATQIEIERRSGAGQFVLLATVGSDVTRFEDLAGETAASPRDLRADSDYAYRLRAVGVNAPSPPTQEVAVRTPPAPRLKLTPKPKELKFGRVRADGTKSKKVRIRNRGPGPFQGGVDPVALPFAVTAGGGPFEIPSGETRLVVVAFAPTASDVGVSHTTEFVLRSDDVRVAPLTYTLSGTGR